MSGFVSRHQSADDCWVDVVQHLLSRRSSVTESRVGACAESIGARIEVVDSLSFAGSRQMSASYACGELAWYLSGDSRTAAIEHYAPSYKQFTFTNSDLERYAPGAYGPTIRFVDDIVWELTKYPDSRRAVVSMWETSRDTPSDLTNPDKPCTLSLQFLIRDGALHLIVSMRSNDAWLGMPYDMFCFMAIQRLAADLLDVRSGTYVHNVGSLHLYEKDFEKAEQRVAAKGRGRNRVPDGFAKHEIRSFKRVAAAASQLESYIREYRLPLDVAEVAASRSMIAGTELAWLMTRCALKNSGLQEDRL